MLVEFHKMQALGNDFVIFKDSIDFHRLSIDQVKRISDRKLGIGCEQLIICKKNPDYIKMKVYNNDGRLISFCGNGIRCVTALYLEDTNEQKSSLLVEADKGFIPCTKNGDVVTVNIGQPVLEWSSIPVLTPIENNEIDLPSDITINSKLLKGFCINIGNPHVVVFVDDFDFNMIEIGSKIENLRVFPKKCMVNFAKVIDRSTLTLQVWESGNGLSLACGSGACASFYAAYKKNLVDDNVNVKFSIGSLNIKLVDENIIMTGEYNYVFSGKIDIE